MYCGELRAKSGEAHSISSMAPTRLCLDSARRVRTRDIQLGRKDATARAMRVFKKALDAGMAHFL